MGFPRALLADHEKVIADIRPHWVALIPQVLWTIVLGAALLVGLSLADNYVRDPRGLRLGIALVVTLVWFIFAVVPFLRWRYTHFVLTSDRLITRHGVIAKHSKEIPLERINDVAFSQTVIERLIGAGDLMVESAGERGQTRIGNVRKPEQLQLMIYKEIETNTDRMMRPGSREPSIPEQIEALARLRDQKAITDEEFESKKQEMLKRL